MGKTFSHFQADAQYKVLESEHTPSLSELEGQLHAWDKLEGGEFWY